MPEKHKLDVEESKTLEAIARALQEIRFGSVEVTIHDGKVVQIEKKEKIRL